ncbi:ABC transporter ATP-binding protein [Anaerovorax odorimutans]|uniref:ABC transporter ATP-binding protein n=1 Tax=Anaerovorax odorimutans TaxID=109327 RepID=A0ABT1RMZ7_9FIRM|nr:ABC transporter ATP-binding protein [Anaerovorax odorimutans]MCQ4636296.1 ABC transporter ATP-binding protein [Anaerovorax odorimutans]
MDTLCIEGLTKKFGAHTVLDEISFTVPEHSVFGFLGQNGAGKTTTMKLILGLLKADGGQIRVLGEPVTYGQTKTNRLVGYLPDVPEFYGYMKPAEYLKLCGEIAGLSKKEIARRSEELLHLVGLEEARKKISGFSRGMKQRLGITQALLTRPKLLICDEPTSALDPVGRRELLNILHQVREQTTVLFSTHILSDAEQICDRIAVLHQGNLALCGELSRIKAQKSANALFVSFASAADVSELTASPYLLPYCSQIEVQGSCLTIRSTDIKPVQQAVLSALYGKGLFPLKMEIQEPTLEGIFMEAIQ